MIPALSSPVGLIAGNGVFPIEFAQSARARGLSVVAVAHRGETDPALEKEVAQCTWVRLGQLGRIIKTLRKAGVSQVAFAGGIKRTSAFRGVKLDLKAISLMARLRSVKDDALLRGVAAEIERSGMQVISASTLLEKSVAHAGVLTRRTLTQDEARNAAIGWEAARAMGALDIGQTVVVNQGVVVAVEAVEGTDQAILRAGQLSGKGAVVVKLAKEQQDLRIDLPAVGVETIRTMHEAGATALILEDEKAVILTPQEVLAAANRAEIAVAVFKNPEDLSNWKL